jgi:hypothetical protein
MTAKDVLEVIHEALSVYIDEISIITEVKLYRDAETGDEGIILTLKNGDTYRLEVYPVLRLLNE